MGKYDSAEAFGRRRKHLAAGVAAILGLASPAAFATVFVTNCNDAGAGSLRNAVAAAPEGSTIDATGLLGVCSTITLKTGDIVANQNNLTIVGPGASDLSITAKYNGSTTHQYDNRIFTHNGTGTLYLQDVTVTKGYEVANPAVGGCIYSKGSVTLKDADVTFCVAKNDGGARGGGISAAGVLTMKESTLSFNSANGGATSGAGGGASAAGFRAYYSSIVLNSATDSGGNDSIVGAIFSTGPTYIFNSTIASSSSTGNVGGLAVVTSGKVQLINSTISSNKSSKGVVGGMYLNAQSVQIENSTITANTAYKTSATQPPGAQLVGQGASPTVVMQSSIFSGNLYGSTPNVDSDLSSTVSITGNSNLVQQSNASLPGDTIVGKCAFLGPLAQNGGLTETHKLLGHSPAIDAGNNTFGANYDQRGSQATNGEQNYPRVSGPPGAVTPRADIGAYEVNRADEIFDAIFENC